MKQITFSIIVVCLNAGDKLIETVDSILAQGYPHFEIIVKDGMSTDGFVEQLPADERIRVVRQKDKSIYDAMNQAVSLADGDYFLFLNCGDFFYDNKVLEKVNKWIAEDKAQTEIYYGDIYNRIVDSKIASNPKINAFACYRNVPCHQACFYAKSLMRRRKYKPQYKVRADYEHFLGSYFEDHVKPSYMPIMISSYEGGGFSETAENRKRSAMEHKEIVNQYMSKAQVGFYRFLMLASLAPLRTKMAESEKMSGTYNSIKRGIYRLMGKK